MPNQSIECHLLSQVTAAFYPLNRYVTLVGMDQSSFWDKTNFTRSFNLQNSL